MARVSQRQLEVRQQEILEAAGRVFVRGGFERTTMQEIAAEASVSTGTLYSYFSGKEELLRTAMKVLEQRERGEWGVRVVSSVSATDALESTLDSLFAVLQHPDVREAAVLDLEGALAAYRDPDGLGAEYREALGGLLAEITQVVSAAQSGGEIDPDVDPAAIVYLVQAVVSGLALMKVKLGDDLDIERVTDLLTALMNSIVPEEA